MTQHRIEPFLRYVDLKRDSVPSFEVYPFNIPAVKSLHRLEFHPQEFLTRREAMLRELLSEPESE